MQNENLQVKNQNLCRSLIIRTDWTNEHLKVTFPRLLFRHKFSYSLMSISPQSSSKAASEDNEWFCFTTSVNVWLVDQEAACQYLNHLLEQNEICCPIYLPLALHTADTHITVYEFTATLFVVISTCWPIHLSQKYRATHATEIKYAMLTSKARSTVSNKEE